MLNKEEKMILTAIENYLFNINRNSMAIYDNHFMVNISKVKDLKALELYMKLYSINEKLRNKKKGSVK